MDGSLSTVEASSSNRKQKPKYLCHYCPNSFQRLEHFQRHERTHTKEKPFACECGKKFSRRDLLLRHVKLVHSSKPGHSNLAGAPILAPRLPGTLSLDDHVNASMEDIGSHSRQLDDMLSESLPDAVRSFPSSSNLHGVPVPQVGFFDGQDERTNFGILPHSGSSFGNNNYQMHSPADLSDDYNLFLDGFDMSNFYLPSSSVFDSELPTSLWCRPDSEFVLESQSRNRYWEPPQQEHTPLSRFGSRLPSLQPEDQDLPENEPVPQADSLRAAPPWKISGRDHREIQAKLVEFASVLPTGFVLPSRHALSQFFEGYISGFHQHLPFLHIPTLVASKCVPELLLAIVAVGAQYRFESNKGNNLWYAARAIATEQTRRRHSEKVAEMLSSSMPRPTTYNKSPLSTGGASKASDENLNQYNGATRDPRDPRLPVAQARLRTIQTLLILMAMGMWGPQALLREAMSLQNQLALLIREQGLESFVSQEDELVWEDWIHIEGDRRTKFIAYCFFNLHSIAYDTPPLLLTSEMKMNLPQSAKEWHADSARQWQSFRRTIPRNRLSFHYILSQLFSAVQGDHPPISSLANYCLIHAIIQQIFFVRKTSIMANPIAQDSRLLPEDIEKFEQMLRVYQIGWERAPESSLDPANPYGPVAFSSTALLRLAYIRLHLNLGPCRRLDTRDPQTIAHALKASPPLTRSPLLSRAILQSAHALSIPVKIGIKFVAHTQTLMWSMQHSLCNLECAFLLSKWLAMIACSLADLTSDERNLLQMVRSIINETDFAVPFDGTESVEESVKQLGIAVVRLWAETFSGSHHVFPLVRDIGAALDIYVDLLEEEL